ncbi:unnamed protein product [Rhizoctonia solani]|uniref:XPG-I domain-containing protein n=1 Tax=Rhizoctonia solani TaxID=456999 RepID=A0A8H3C5W7_9AGAM|nr:unnamed protein product [Rhizoctonia solani]
MPNRWISFCEIHWRYYIVAGTDHIGTLEEYNKDAGQYYEIWLPKSRSVDLEDALTILHAFTQRMQSTSILYPLPDVPTMGAMLSFVAPRSGLIPGVEDLFIPLVRVVFNYFWMSVAGKSLHTKFRLEAEDVATVVHPAFVMVEHLVKHTPTRAKEFVKELINLGIIESLSRGFALIKREPSLDEQAKFSPLIRVCHESSNSLLRVGPPMYRETEFADTLVEWFKALRYLRSQDCMLNTRTDHTNWYEMSNRAWVEIGDILENDVQVPRAEAMSRGCAFSGCPDPDSVRGVRFECPCDKVVVYCGPRCHQMDWLPPDTPHPRALRIGIDASIWFFHAAYGREGENPELRTLFFRLAKLAKYTFCPLFVFDGPHRPRTKRQDYQYKDELTCPRHEKHDICVWAPGEAEAELAYLNNIGVIDAILSDDVDNFLFGARVVIRNPSGTLTGNRGYPALNREGKDDGVHVMVYRMDDIEKDPACKLTRGGMILIALLSGGDYDQGAKRCGPKTALALAQRGLGDELLNAFETFSRQKFIDYIPAWKNAVVEALHSGCANLEGDEADVEDLEEESQETVITASQNSASGGNKGKGKLSSKSKKKKPPAKRQPALAAALAASDFPDLSVLEDYCAPWTSERAFSAGVSSRNSDEADAPPASQGSVITSSQTSTTSTSRSKKKPMALTAKSIGTGGLTSDVRIGWTGELALGALGRICEQYFEWGVREIIQQRFRTVLWPAVVLRVLRRSVMEQERAQGLSDSRDATPRPSTPTRDKTNHFIPGTPQKLVNRYFGGDSDSESDREAFPRLVKSKGGDATPRAKRRISIEGEELDTHQLLQAVRGERQHASTDGLQEFRVEVAPGHLARLAVRDLLGTRDPALLAGTLFDLEGAVGKEADEEQEEGDDDEGSTKRLKIVDPSTSIRVWAPAELVSMVHPGLVRDWEAKKTKTKSRAKAGGSTSRQRSKEDVGTGKKVKSTTKSSSKDKAALKEKPSNIPTTLSGDEVEQPDQPTIPLKRQTNAIRVRSASPGMPRPPPVASSSRAPSGKGSRLALALNTIPERSSSPTILPERSSSPVVTHPPPLPRPTKTKSAPTPLITGASKDSRRAGIPGVEYVPTPPRREKAERSVGNDSSELEDVNFGELLGRPKKHSVPEPDSESESDLGGPSKSSRRYHAHTSPRNSSGSEIEIIKLNPKQDKTRKPTSVANSARRPTTRSQSSSSGSEVEILDCSFLPSRPAKHKSPPMDDAAERVASAPRQVRRTSREHASPRASSTSEGENPKPHVPSRKPTAKWPARSVSESARSSGKLKESIGSKGTPRLTSADISEGVIEISSDDGGPLLPETILASKTVARSTSSTARVAQIHAMTRPDKPTASAAESRSSSPPLETSDSSIIDLISD